MDSSEAPQDLLGLSPKPSEGPSWEGTPLAGSMLELEAEERRERQITQRDPSGGCQAILQTPPQPPEPGILQNRKGGGILLKESP